MSLRAMTFEQLAAELEQRSRMFADVAELADGATEDPPARVASVPVEGVRRPVEDLVVAREESGVYGALDAARAHAVQAALHIQYTVDYVREAAGRQNNHP